jgi:hypothetical protein
MKTNVLCIAKISKFEKKIFRFGYFKFLRESMHGYLSGDTWGVVGGVWGGGVVCAHFKRTNTHTHTVVARIHTE